jgi:hypothetical protein
MKMVRHDELRTLMDSIRPETLICFRGRLCERSPFGDTRSLMIELVSTPADEELTSALRSYKTPVVKRDLVLGELSLNKTVGWYEGHVAWCGRQVELALPPDGSGDVAAAVATMKSLLQDQSGWKRKNEDYAVNTLLELKNENWLDEGEEEVTKEEFASRMVLESIIAYPDGEYEFWYSDGDLFWGHSILVSGDLKSGPNDADIPG